MKLLTAALFTLIPLSAYAVTPEEVVKYLLNNSLDIKTAKKSVEKERINKVVTKREFFPEINLSASFSEFYPDFKESWNQKYSLGATVSAEPINFQRFVKLEIDLTRIKAKEEKLKETLLEQLFLALKELYNLKAYQERILFKEESLRSAKEILKVAQEKYKKGLVMITDVLKAKSQVENVKGELSKLKAQYRQSFNRLNELLNFSLSEEEKPQFEFLKEKVSVEKRELLRTALEMRPEVKEAKEEVKENSLRVKYTQRTLSPRLNLSFSWNRSGTSFWPQDRNYSAGVSLSFPIFDSGLTTYRTMAQEKEKEISLINLKKVKNRVKREVLDAIADVESGYENLKSAEAFLEFSKRAYERTLNEYKLGVSDIVSLLQAYTNLKEAQDRYVSSLLNYNVSLLSLKKATGELLTEVKK